MYFSTATLHASRSVGLWLHAANEDNNFNKEIIITADQVQIGPLWKTDYILFNLKKKKKRGILENSL